MIVVTGGAGFIGSVLAWALNQRGRTDVVLVDEVNHAEKERNIAPLGYHHIVDVEEFKQQLLNDRLSYKVEAIFHLGAISSTTETDWNKFLERNVNYTKAVIQWCVDHNARCVYASSGATYGNGQQGFSDDHALFDQLKPLNLYGKSKLDVDIWARDNSYLEKVVGLRYFNVFGPNEQHKEHMRSVVAKKFEQLEQNGVVELFKSYNPNYQDGDSTRDFIYIFDAVDATLFFLDHSEANGVFNIGTGQARSWNDLARAMFAAVNKEPNIRYIDMPENLRNQYQYFTQADITKLRAAGYDKPFLSLEDSVKDYIQTYLLTGKHVGE